MLHFVVAQTSDLSGHTILTNAQRLSFSASSLSKFWTDSIQRIASSSSAGSSAATCSAIRLRTPGSRGSSTCVLMTERPFFYPHPKKTLIITANILISLSAQSRTCPWVSAGPLIGEDTVRYLELTPPVAIPAFREMRGHLKQRRCGPFCSLPAFHQPGLLKRHTIIAGSAVGKPPIQGRQSRTYAIVWRWFTDRASCVCQGSGVSTGWVLRRVRVCPLSSGVSTGACIEGTTHDHAAHPRLSRNPTS